MIIAHSGDWHIAERRDESGMTLDEQVELLRWCAEDAEKHGSQALLHGGDLFDAASTPAERKAAIDAVSAWAERMPVVITKGNHDRLLDLYYLGRVRSRHPITVLERPDVLTVAGIRIACLPWPRKSQLVAAMDSTSALEVGAAARDALLAILVGFRAAFDGEASPRILLGHAELGGARLDNGQPVAGRCDVALHEGDLLDVGADAVLLSHIHLHQVLGDGRIVYAGSPRPTRFGEEAPKGYCLVDVERGREPVVRHRQAPYRELETIEAEWVDGELREDGASIVDSIVSEGVAYRLVYAVGEANRRSAAEQSFEARRRWLAAGAHSVKLDPRVITTHRVRSEEIRTAVTVADRLRVYWAARGEEPTRAAEILDKLTSLEVA